MIAAASVAVVVVVLLATVASSKSHDTLVAGISSNGVRSAALHGRLARTNRAQLNIQRKVCV